MAAVIIAPHPSPAPSPCPPRRPHLRPVPDLPRDRPVRPSPVVLRRRRIAVALVALVALAASVLGASRAVSSVLGSSRAAAPERTAVAAPSAPSGTGYVVRSGDTLWSIAARIDPDGDVRAIVDALAERTGGVDLRPGQIIDLDGLG